MALKKKLQEILLVLSNLTKLLESSLQSESRHLSLASDLRKLKISRIVSLNLTNKITYYEEDEDIKDELREYSDKVVDKAEEVMFLAEDMLDLPTDPKMQNDYGEMKKLTYTLRP